MTSGSATFRYPEWAVLALLIAVFLGIGFAGLDFGRHWDEPYLLSGMRHSVETLTFLPQGYFYNGAYFAIGYAAIAPEMAGFFRHAIREARTHPTRPFDPHALPGLQPEQARLKAFLESKAALLRMRGCFLLLSALAVPCVFGLAVCLHASRTAALFAAGLMASSWEFGYHSRFAALDCVLVMLVTLCVFLALASVDAEGPRRDRLQRLAALATGLALGTKAAALLLFLPLGVAVFLSRKEMAGRAWLLRFLKLAGMALFTAVVITPGLLLDPVRAVNDWAWGSADYIRVAPTYTYYSGGYLKHLGSIAGYVAMSALSPYAWLSAAIFVLAIAGLVLLWKESPGRAVLLLSFPAAYYAGIARTNLFLVRNYQLFIPFLAAGAAFAVHRAILQTGGRRYARYACAALASAACVAGLGFGAVQAATIRPMDRRETARWCIRYVASHPRMHIAVSDAVQKAAGEEIAHAPDKPSYYAFFYEEIEHEIRAYALTVRRGLFAGVFGSHEVNFDYSPNFIGQNTDSRILIMSMADARRFGAIRRDDVPAPVFPADAGSVEVHFDHQLVLTGAAVRDNQLLLRIGLLAQSGINYKLMLHGRELSRPSAIHVWDQYIHPPLATWKAGETRVLSFALPAEFVRGRFDLEIGFFDESDTAHGWPTLRLPSGESYWTVSAR